VELLGHEAHDADEGGARGGDVEHVVAVAVELGAELAQQAGLAHARGSAEQGIEARTGECGAQAAACADVVGVGEGTDLGLGADLGRGTAT